MLVLLRILLLFFSTTQINFTLAARIQICVRNCTTKLLLNQWCSNIFKYNNKSLYVPSIHMLWGDIISLWLWQLMSIRRKSKILDKSLLLVCPHLSAHLIKQQCAWINKPLQWSCHSASSRQPVKQGKGQKKFLKCSISLPLSLPFVLFCSQSLSLSQLIGWGSYQSQRSQTSSMTEVKVWLCITCM